MKIKLGTACSFHQKGLRDNQEDSRFPDFDFITDAYRLFVVCDGVGGQSSGEVASQIVCQSFGKSAEKLDYTCDFTNAHFQKVLNDAYDALDSVALPENESMATTLAFACFHAGGCTLAHIGDSSIFHIRPSEGVIYRSDAHSLVNHMVHAGIIAPSEADEHPQSHVITRCMQSSVAGYNRSMATVVRIIDVQQGDYFFLCTDGVTGCVSDQFLSDILSTSAPDKDKMETICRSCVNSSDNNTAILIPIAKVEMGNEEFDDDDADTKKTHVNRKKMEASELGPVKENNKQNFWKKIKKLF